MREKKSNPFICLTRWETVKRLVLESSVIWLAYSFVTSNNADATEAGVETSLTSLIFLGTFLDPTFPKQISWFFCLESKSTALHLYFQLFCSWVSDLGHTSRLWLNLFSLFLKVWNQSTARIVFDLLDCLHKFNANHFRVVLWLSVRYLLTWLFHTLFSHLIFTLVLRH